MPWMKTKEFFLSIQECANAFISKFFSADKLFCSDFETVSSQKLGKPKYIIIIIIIIINSMETER
jgi:hypothetical protein